jgi:hypothetical protein
MYRFTITNDVPMVVDLDDSKFTLPAGTVYTGNKYEQIGSAIFLDTNESGCISVDFEDVKIEPIQEPKKMAHCHFCPEHVLTDKEHMEKFMLRKCEQKFVCKGHLHLVKANHLLKLVRPAQAAQAHLF